MTVRDSKPRSVKTMGCNVSPCRAILFNECAELSVTTMPMVSLVCVPKVHAQGRSRWLTVIIQGRSVTVNYVYATGIFRNDVYAKRTKSEYFLKNLCIFTVIWKTICMHLPFFAYDATPLTTDMPTYYNLFTRPYLPILQCHSNIGIRTSIRHDYARLA